MNVFSKAIKAVKEVLGEYKLVKWPTLKTTISLALFVIVISAIITLVILGIDAFLFELRSRFIIS